MQNEKITLEEFREEVADMFTACFEGNTVFSGGVLEFTFVSGQKFRIGVEEITDQA